MLELVELIYGAQMKRWRSTEGRNGGKTGLSQSIRIHKYSTVCQKRSSDKQRLYV